MKQNNKIMELGGSDQRVLILIYDWTKKQKMHLRGKYKIKSKIRCNINYKIYWALNSKLELFKRLSPE